MRGPEDREKIEEKEKQGRLKDLIKIKMKKQTKIKNR